jgi:apolipoprotein N-acyltransferase
MSKQEFNVSDLDREKSAVHRDNDNFWERIKRIPTHHLAWLWLLVGFMLLPFTFWQTVIPLAAWLAPVFLLRFAHTCKHPRIVQPLLFLAYAAAIFIALRGGSSMPLLEYIIGVIILPVAHGLMFSLPYLADRLISRRLGQWGRTLVFPLAFTTLDWLMSMLVLVMNTGSPAYSQYGNIALMQIISVTGMWGLTFLITWFASTVNALWESHFNWRMFRSQLILFTSTLAAVLLFGFLRLNQASASAPTVQAATITIDAAVSKQAGSAVNWVTFNQSTDAERAAARPKFEATVDQMLARTETALRAGAKIVGWQEASALVLEEDKPGVLERVSALAKQYDATIQIGLWVATRTPGRDYTRNQSILIDNTGQVAWTYDKTHPVFLDEAYITIPGAGKLPVVTTAYGRMSTAICNDLHFPALIRQAGQNDVDIFMAPYGDIIPFGYEDFVVADYRAIENGFSMVRATGNGLSAVIDPLGRVLSSQDYFTNSSGIMLGAVPTRRVPTIYSRIGDAFAYLSVAGLVLLAVKALASRKLPLTASPSLPHNPGPVSS